MYTAMKVGFWVSYCTHLAAVNPQSIQAQVAKTQGKVVQPGGRGRGGNPTIPCKYKYGCIHV